MKTNYQWQGELIKVKFGNCVVKVNKDKPLWWYNYDCSLTHEDSACIEAIKITTKDGYTFMIANHFGIGIHKVSNGGWPNYGHSSLDGEFSTKPQCRLVDFDLEGYEQYQQGRRAWQKENYPEEFANSERLRGLIRKSKI